MFESRCGVCCNKCERKANVNCQGCTKMTKSFWGGDCSIKTCCEAKGLDHCGLCPDFPCQMLNEFGKDQGYDPAPRLAQCREWAQR